MTSERSPSPGRKDGKQLILDVALELFTKRGYEETSVDDLRRAAGFRSKASLYAHFSSKEAVVEALSTQIFHQMEQVIVSAYERAGSKPLHILRETLRAFIYWGLTHPDEYTFRFIRNQQEKLLRGQFDYAKTQFSEAYVKILNLIQRLRQQYPVRAIADEALISMTAGLISRAVIDRDAFGDISLDDQVEQVIELCMGLLFEEPLTNQESG